MKFMDTDMQKATEREVQGNMPCRYGYSTIHACAAAEVALHNGLIRETQV